MFIHKTPTCKCLMLQGVFTIQRFVLFYGQKAQKALVKFLMKLGISNVRLIPSF